MRIPRKEELYNPILGYLLYHGKATVSEIYDAMAKHFFMQTSKSFNRVVNEAISHLYHAGLIDRVRRGEYAILNSGSIAVDNFHEVNDDYLREFPSYRSFEEWKAEGGKKNSENPKHYPTYDDVEVPNRIGYPEYIQKEILTIEDVEELCEKDTRFANMMATGAYTLEEGHIIQIPAEVVQHDMTLAEFNATTMMHGTDAMVAAVCMASSDGTVQKSMTPLQQEGYHRKSSKIMLGGGNGSYVPPTNPPTSPFANFQRSDDILTKVRQCSSLAEAMTYIVKTAFATTKDELEAKSGVGAKTIQRMMNEVSYRPNLNDLLAVSRVLNLDSLIVSELMDLANHSARNPQNSRYLLVYNLSKNLSYEETNKLCVDSGINEIFNGPKSAGLSGIVKIIY